MHKERIKYYDTLRFLAVLGVISLHILQDWHNAGAIGNNFYSISEITRFGVPIFLMMIGALLLNKDIELKDFFKRRFSRIIYPFILFLIIHVVTIFILKEFNITQLRITLGYNWYFWLIIGIYLFIPIINKFVQNCNIKELEYFVLVILIGSLFYQCTLFYKITHFIDLSFFIGPISFLILGYYLSIKKFKLSSKKNNFNSNSIIYYYNSIEMGGQVNIPYNLVHNYQATRNAIINSFLDLSFIKLIQAGSLFTIIKEIHQSKKGLILRVKNILENNIINKFITSISKSSYGMYLFHHTLIDPIALFIGGIALSKPETALLIGLEIICIFIISWVVILVINKIPYLSKWSGYH